MKQKKTQIGLKNSEMNKGKELKDEAQKVHEKESRKK